MSLRFKFLYLLILVMMAVTCLITGYSLLDASRMQILQRKTVADLAAGIVEANFSETGDLAAAGRAAAGELAHLRFFTSWALVTPKVDIVYSEGTPEGTGQFDRIALLNAATSPTSVSGNTVSASILKDGKPVGALWGLIDVRSVRKIFPSSDGGTVVPIVILAMAFILLIAYTAIYVRVLRPLERLSEGAGRVEGGDYDRPVKAPGASSEVGHLVDAFNAMQTQVRESTTGLEERVRVAAEKVVEGQRQLAAAQRLGAIGVLASGVAHEINNPLGGMMNAMKALKSGELGDAKTEQYHGLIVEGLETIKETVDRMLQFAPRPTAGGHASVAEAAIGAIALVQYYAAEHNVRLVTGSTECPPACVNPGELKQILVNLLINAVDASAEDSEIQVEACEEEDRVAIRVADNGCGMTEEQTSKIFEPFYTTKEAGSGSGLGLPIVAGIAERNGGEVRVDSAPDRGTTVTVLLPRTKEGE